MRYREIRESLCRQSPVLAQKLFFRYEMGRFPNLREPKTFNEKLSWIMLYDLPRFDLPARAADKYAFRSMIEEMGLGDYLLPLLGVWDSAAEIDFDDLPNSFMIKCNHGCDFNIPCADKSMADLEAIRRKLDDWMQVDWSLLSAEGHYRGIERKIIAEPLIGADDDVPCVDYKYYCIGSEPVFLSVVQGAIKDSSEADEKRITFYDRDCAPTDFQRADYQRIPEDKQPNAEMAGKLWEVSRFIALNLPFQIVRVDFLVHGDEAHLLELTLTPTAGHMPIDPPEWDLKLGEMVQLPYSFKLYKWGILQ